MPLFAPLSQPQSARAYTARTTKSAPSFGGPNLRVPMNSVIVEEYLTSALVHDISGVRPNNTKLTLLESMDPTSSIFEHPQSSKRYDLLRFFKIQSLAPFKLWTSSRERRKIARHWSHRMAAGHALLHLIPLCSALSLLGLNWSEYYIGPEFTLAATLQFVAKLHELFMQASIVEIVLSIVRKQVMDGYLPLGALSASMHALQISYLWSLDYLAAITARSIRGWQRFLFIIMIPTLIILTILVGPSSAALMLPRPGVSSRARVFTWHSKLNIEEMFPSSLDERHNLTLDINHFATTYNFRETEDGQYVNTQMFSNKKDFDHLLWISRVLRYSVTSRSTKNELYQGSSELAIATMPTQLSALALGKVGMSYDSNRTASIVLPRPVIRANCQGYSGRIVQTDSMITYIRDDGHNVATLSSFGDLIRTYVNNGGQQEHPIRTLPPIWTASPEPGSSSYIFSLVDDSCASKLQPVSAFLLDEQFGRFNSCATVSTCTVNAFWQSSEHKMRGNEGLRLVHTDPFREGDFDIPKDSRSISIDWNNVSNLRTVEYRDMINNQSSRRSLGLAVSLATVISEMHWETAFAGLKYKPQDGAHTDLVVKIASYGYGYGTSSVSVRLALAVISAYCIVIVVYVTYILVSGHTSTAWNSATELLILALQSERPHGLKHTSVGINSMQTYREPVGIRVNDKDELELVFAKDQKINKRKLKRVAPNKAY